MLAACRSTFTNFYFHFLVLRNILLRFNMLSWQHVSNAATSWASCCLNMLLQHVLASNFLHTVKTFMYLKCFNMSISHNFMLKSNVKITYIFFLHKIFNRAVTCYGNILFNMLQHHLRVTFHFKVFFFSEITPIFLSK